MASDTESDISVHEEIDEDHELNFQKYKTGYTIVHKVMHFVCKYACQGKTLLDVAKFGDDLMKSELDKIYRKKKLDRGKGIAMPTCVSVNEIAAFYSPLENHMQVLKEGDVIKIELGVHIDGFPCISTRTKYLSYDNDPNREKIENVLKALDMCVEKVKGCLKVDKNMMAIQDELGKVVEKYGVNLVDADTELPHIAGLYCWQISRDYLDTYNRNDDEYKLVPNNRKSQVYVKDQNFRTNDVMMIDIMLSTGEGKLRLAPIEPTVYIKNSDIKYNLKRKASRYALSKFSEKAGNFFGSVRGMDDSKFKFGLKECVKQRLIEPLFILREKEGEFIVQSKFPCIIKFKKNYYM